MSNAGHFATIILSLFVALSSKANESEPLLPVLDAVAADASGSDCVWSPIDLDSHDGSDVSECSFSCYRSSCHCWTCECPEAPQPCQECPRINNLNPAWSLLLGGSINMDALYNSARPVAPGTPFYLAPKGPFEDNTFDIHGRSTSIYLAAKGPKIGDLEAGGLVMFCLYNDSIAADRYGFLPYQAFGELKNEQWRFAGGLQLDIFAPVLPTVLPFSVLAASGNTGLYRGQVRAERFFYPGEDEQVTLTVGVSDANPTIFNEDVLSEDNGWPNVEARIGWAAGPLEQAGLVAQRPFEIGVSGVVGQVRSTDLGPLERVTANVWGMAADFRWRVSKDWGFAGEYFTGEGLGTYGSSGLQIVNTATFEAIRVNGGWTEVYFYLTPCLHTHWGYAVDDPTDRDTAAGQVTYNDTVFSNLLWDVTKSFRLGAEVTYRETEYAALPGNEGVGLHGQMQWKF